MRSFVKMPYLIPGGGAPEMELYAFIVCILFMIYIIFVAFQYELDILN